MKNYLDLVSRILTYGEERKTRNGTTLGTFGHHLSWNLQVGFPILTTKEMKPKSIFSELCWILEGSSNDKRLQILNDTETTIWTANAAAYDGDYPGDCGQIYGPLLRNFHGVDQLHNIIKTLIENPTDRRMLVTMWDPSARNKQCLPTCHFSWQVYVRDGQFLDMYWAQRSVDVGLGLPYDIVHYAALNHLICQTVHLQPGILHCWLGDTHIYTNQIDGLERQLARDPYDLPELELDPFATVFNVEPMDFEILEYKAHPPIKLPFSV